MDVQNPTYAYLHAFVNELGRAGVRHAVICPGSRSTPLALTFASQSLIKSWVLIDERSAAFFALGIAKATIAPVVLVCTSGTAAANFLPAIAEARLGRVPLIVLTADRPPELQDVGAPQAMDQVRLYGTHVNWFTELALPEAHDPLLRYSRVTANRAVATAISAPAGPIHLNVPLREPLTPAPIPDQPLPKVRDGIGWTGRADNQPYVTVPPSQHVLDDTALRALADLIGGKRGMFVIGPQPSAHLIEPLTQLAATLNWPILADPLSEARHGPFDHGLVIDSYDAFLRDPSFVDQAAPEVVIRFGAMPVSKPLMQFFAVHPQCTQIVVDNGGGWNDPTLTVAQLVHAAELPLIHGLLACAPQPADSHWRSLWQSAQQTTRASLNAAIDQFPVPFEGRVFTEFAAALPPNATLVVGNRMPIRDCDTFLGGRQHPLRVLGNRGVNGIDGVVSTGLGVAATSDDPVVLVLGDLSFYHDLNGLLAAKLHGLKLTVVVINNDGGGIFSFLPQAAYPEHFETLFGTPHGLDFQPVVEMYGGSFRRVQDWGAFRAALAQGVASDGLHVIELPTDRAQNVVLHRELWQVVAQARAEQHGEVVR